ncbi:MAG: alpha/beta fold hydrolase [Nevskiales bacterium]
MSAAVEDAVFYHSARVEPFQTGDATLALRRFGSGPALLLIHGFPLHGFTWRKLLPELSRHFTCYVVDLAGKGDSEWSAATDFSFAAHARRLKQLVDHLGLQRYNLMGQDTGATIARCLALIDLKRVEKMVLINTEMPGHRPPWIQLYQMMMRLPGAAFVFRLQLRLRWFVRSGMGFGGCFSNLDLLNGEFHEQFIAPYIHSQHRTDGMARYLMGIPWDVVDSLKQRHQELSMPVLLVWGEDDPTFPIQLAREMTGQFPDCRGLVAIPQTKLLPHEERAPAVLTAVLPFLTPATKLAA